jgi:hypothetical protein
VTPILLAAYVLTVWAAILIGAMPFVIAILLFVGGFIAGRIKIDP